MQKPIIIYSLARTKSTATLQAARRDNLLHEPFSPWSIIENYHEVQAKENLSAIEINNRLLKLTNWADLKDQMSNKNAAIKFFGSSLHNYYPAQKWFSDVVKNDSHEIFILLRNLEDTIWSYLLATKFGFTKDYQLKPFKFAVNEYQLFSASNSIDYFLDFFPKGKQIVTFNTLPEDFFDYSKISLRSQKSQDKRFLIENYNYAEDQIQKILENKKARWEDVTQTNIYTNW